MPDLLDCEFNEFVSGINLEALTGRFTEQEKSASLKILSSFTNEAKVTLSMIGDSLNKESRILEVGAGLCLLSLFLKSKGYQITALEPIGVGFDFFDQLKTQLLNTYSNLELPVLDKTAQKLTEIEDGKFDLIFSNNVVEHIDELDEAFLAMAGVLNNRGEMIHSCANYAIPYEPHFGLPILFWSPALTKLVWREKIAQQDGVWASLNFVTYFRVRAIARNIDCGVEFKRSMTYEAFSRLRTDKEFKSRHQGTLVWKIFRFLEVSRLLKLMKLLPAWASTPMIFTMTRNKA
jgi:2-polyprenyl-3-methyl-5-hydroxy-6-metoxy-1,4-benzoquinol methylase